jgi:hypothetical protein
MSPGSTRCWVWGSFGTRTGIYLAPQRGGANFCGMMGWDIGGQQRCRPASRAKSGGQELSVDFIGLAVGIEHGYIPEEILWCKAEGRTPLDDHPGLSAGMVVWNLALMPCENLV